MKWDPGGFPQGEGLFSGGAQGEEGGLRKQCAASPAYNERLTVMDSGDFSSLACKCGILTGLVQGERVLSQQAAPTQEPGNRFS